MDTPATPAPAAGLDPGRQLLLGLQWDEEPSFETFEPGANAMVLQALLDLLRARQGGALYLWGPHASGKTHLLRAACAQAQQDGRWVCYLGPDSPPSRWPGLDTLAQAGAGAVLAVDDVQACTAWQQDLLFGLFNLMRQSGGCFIAAGDQAPATLPLRDDVRTRLGWGLALSLQALDDDAKRRVLQRIAAARGLELRDDLSRYILVHHARDMASLVHLLHELDAYAMRHGRAASIPLLKAMVAHPDQAPAL